jgi:hypothetical protein
MYAYRHTLYLFCNAASQGKRQIKTEISMAEENWDSLFEMQLTKNKNCVSSLLEIDGLSFWATLYTAQIWLITL